jgi:hypothetical protein
VAAPSEGSGPIAFACDFAPIVVATLVYFWLRGLGPFGSVQRAVDLTVRLIDFEKVFGIFRERDLQEATLHWAWTKELANYVYSYLHFPALIGVGAWIWLRDRRLFRTVRNTLYISMVIGLFFYYLVPAAPPRLMALYGHDYGFVDTVFGGGTSVRYPQPGLFENDYAAIPSFHFGWMALVSVALWSSTRNPFLRAFAFLLLAAMTWASAATANHLFVDMALGGIVILVAWRLNGPVVRLWRRAARPPRRPPASSADR